MNSSWQKIYTNEIYEDVLSKIKAEQEKAALIVDTILKNEAIVKALAQKDRDTLIKLATPYQEMYKQKYDFHQLHFITADGISFVRMASLQRFGDDLKTYRPDIAFVVNNRQPTHSVSVGALGPMIRYIAPVVEVKVQAQMAKTLSSMSEEMKRISDHLNNLVASFKV